MEVSNQQQLPNSTTVLVLGILSIATCFCYGIPGLVLGIIALVMSSKGKKLHKENPEAYSEASYKNLNAGRICAIIGTCLSGLYALIIIFYLLVLGAALSFIPWETLG
ncbi:MAG TPA: hypothetical protein DDX39_02545 [Bacteroidales bacterium]|nr:MAG: hypothetical protein A2W98_03560 [Bacteroidetes bacterium GWF2_33_38]OFY68190.1 MAG: hypothetical protein A2265_01310 [Bacteroidetes bacterium RIFOXYA12_FULL_33_9]HBF87495.1 hypothetical protein [Bacteroidales bacterium]